MKQRLYHVDAVNDRAGTRERQTTHPMPHDAACTFVSKQSDGSKRAGVRFVLVAPFPHEVDHAVEPLTSYRMASNYSGYILIGARDIEDAKRQALRSTDRPRYETLEVWRVDRYVPA